MHVTQNNGIMEMDHICKCFCLLYLMCICHGKTNLANYVWFLKKKSLIKETNNIKHTNIHILGVQGEKKRKEIKNIFEEIMAENFPMKKETYPGIGSTERPNKDIPVKTHTKTYDN